MTEPIDNIQWRNASELDGNNYNPNMVLTPELKLLEHSILVTGWVQPILIDLHDTIIDGFHRWRLSQDSKKLNERYKGQVPCAVLDISRAEAMMLTVRINRAKGSHAALRMSELVKELADEHGLGVDEIAKGIGATKQEVELLHQDNIFKARNIKQYKYSKAWVPKR